MGKRVRLDSELWSLKLNTSDKKYPRLKSKVKSWKIVRNKVSI